MKRRSDFTLVELAILIVIFAMFAIVFCGCGKGPFERRHRLDCANNLKQIGTALELYSISNDGRLPAGPALVGADSVEDADFYGGGRAGGFELLRFNDNLTDYKVYVCPSSSTSEGKGTQSLSWTDAGNTGNKATASYAYAPNLNKGDGPAGKPGSGVCADLTGDSGVNSNGGAANHSKFGNILFLDGHVKGYDGLGWFSPERAGYPMYKKGDKIMIPNTLRDVVYGTL